MDHHPPDDRRISSGAVVAAWAIVAGLVAATLLASALAPPKPVLDPLAEQAALHVGGCADEGGPDHEGGRTLRE
jgi:predicted benzoate:H+ symporter BenE